MKQPLDFRQKLISIFANGALVVFGLGIALGLMELLMRTHPNWVPREIRVDPPVRRVQSLSDLTYDIKPSSGDLYYWMRGTIAPVPPNQDKVLARVHLMTDANGFRNALPELDTYDFVALGDSFTIGGNVAAPWPQMLAKFTVRTVLNLGEAGIGPQQELEILRRYGLASSPRWVILAYFEGNDLYDTASYEQASPLILSRFGKYILGRGLEAFGENRPASAQANVEPTYRYPITIEINDQELEMAFFSPYISWSSASGELIKSSRNYLVASQTIVKMRELSESVGAQFLLVYVPSSIHVYLPYLNDAQTLERIFADVQMLDVDKDGYLQFTDQTVAPGLARQQLDDQAQLLAGFAAEQNIPFLDLTASFQEEAGTGAELYYPYDTHWNQRGHDLAAQIIATYIENLPAVSSVRN